MKTIKEIEDSLDRTFHRSGLADDDDEIYLSREVFALEEAVRDILNVLRFILGREGEVNQNGIYD